MNLATPIRLRAPGMPSTIKTVEQALEIIESRFAPELQRLPRWNFARALLIEAVRTKKSRDLKAAARQLQQALSNEGWLVSE
jgi:hypothetical protein